MAFVLRIIKPCRIQSRSPELKKARAIKNYKRGVETSLVLDLNILSKMNEVETGEVTFEESGLKGFVHFLNSIGGTGLALTPGFALQEVQNDLLVRMVDSFESFLSKYCRFYIDHPNANKSYDDLKDRPAEFMGLPLSEQCLNSISYIGILKTQLISRNDRVLSPEQKFNRYLEYMISKADMVGAIEAEAAKYVFFDAQEIKDGKLRIYCNRIKDNFKKGGDTPEKLLQKCLNAARDLMYYRLTAQMSNRVIDGRLQDAWLITADEGLSNLSESIHYAPNVENRASGPPVIVERKEEQQRSKYWNYCDSALNFTIESRYFIKSALKQDSQSTDARERLLECVKEAEQEIIDTFNNREV